MLSPTGSGRCWIGVMPVVLGGELADLAGTRPCVRPEDVVAIGLRLADTLVRAFGY